MAPSQLAAATTAKPTARHGAGGRAPQHTSMPSLCKTDRPNGRKTWLTPSAPSAARLTVVQITDVYTLDNFCHLKTALKEIRAAQAGDRVISMLTGDFLSPYRTFPGHVVRSLLID